MPKLPKQLTLQHHSHGGWRAGAGRPKSKTAGVSHLKRIEVKTSYPMHLTVRLRAGVPTLRATDQVILNLNGHGPTTQVVCRIFSSCKLDNK